MKFDYYEIEYLETENDAVSLARLKKEQQYLYVKISKRYPEKIFTVPITLQNGKQYNVKFVKVSDLQELKRNKRKKRITPSAKR